MSGANSKRQLKLKLSGSPEAKLRRYNRWCLYVLVRSTFVLANRRQRQRWFGTRSKNAFLTQTASMLDRECRGSRKAEREFDQLFAKAEKCKDKILAAT